MEDIDEEMRLRVERLVRDDFRTDDITHLFMYLRDRCDGREAVAEVGNFVAHRDRRTIGLVTRRARDVFIHALFILENLGRPIDLANLPHNFTEILQAVFRLLDSKAIRHHTGLMRPDAAEVLTQLTPKFGLRAIGIFGLIRPLSPIEVSLLKCLTSYLAMTPAFTGDGLFNEWIASLRSNGLVKKGETKRLAQYKPALILYATAVMHRCVLDLGDGKTARLEADRDALGVQAYVPFKNRGFDQFLGYAIFHAELDPSTHCEPELLGPLHGMGPDGKPFYFPRPEWDFPLELDQNRKLRRLR